MSKQQIQNTKGWNWGNYELREEEFQFNVNGQPSFAIPY